MPLPPDEHVVLVDDDNHPLGTADKASIHHAQTPLHRGFSVFLFDRDGNLLLQQRSHAKRTWPGVWSNSCCGHPQMGETTVQAMQRRIHYELGIANVPLTVILPHFRYRHAHHGVVEHELCPVAVGVIDAEPQARPDEVAALRWVAWHAFLSELDGDHGYSQWSAEEARLLTDHPRFRAFYEQLAGT